MTSKEIEKTYEAQPYVSYQYQNSSPNKLAIIGYIYGLDLPDINKARVLELGCSMGGNIISLASRYKEAKFTGIDLSKKQIEIGNEIIKKLNLKNITLITKDITEIRKSLGEFDYIIVHGVYSWVPQAVKEAIMRVCGECLSENGVAYISYNTYPGWKGKEIVRDIMLFNMDKNSPTNTLDDGLDVLNYMRENVGDNFIKKLLDDSFSQFESYTPSYIMHEYFELFNQPNYFHEVVDLARKNGLDYLSEADYARAIFPPIRDEVKQRLIAKCSNDRVKFEQYIDFVINKTFRSTLFCKKDFAKNIDLSFEFKIDKLDRLNLAGKFSYDGSVQRYRANNGYILPAGTPMFFEYIDKSSPSTINVGRYIKEFCKSDEDRAKIYNAVVTLLMNDLCYISLNKETFLKEIPKKPRVNSEILNLAKYKVESSSVDNISFFTPRNGVFRIDKNLDHRVIALLDGSRDIERIADEIVSMSKDGVFSFVIENSLVKSDDKIKELATARANSLVLSLFSSGMLV